MLIRALTAADRERWEPLWQGYLVFYQSAVAPEVTDTTFERLTGGAEPMGGFVAEADGELIGLTHWIMHRSCWTIGNYCYLQDLFVALGRRGGGIGRRLIEAVYAKAESLGCSRVHWLTHETNTTAMQLYDKVASRPGFVQYRKVL